MFFPRQKRRGFFRESEQFQRSDLQVLTLGESPKRKPLLPDFAMVKPVLVDKTCLCIPACSQILEVFCQSRNTSQTYEENLQHESLTKANRKKEFSGVRDNGESRRKKWKSLN